MKLNCKSIGYYRRGESWFRGPLIINSNNFYQWGDNFVIKYIGSPIPRHTFQADFNDPAANLINPVEIAPDTMHQIVETPPAHIRYYTIAKENPITVIYETRGPDVEDIIISFKILSTDNMTDCQILEDNGNSIIPNKRAVWINCNQQIKIEKFGINDLWENNNKNFFYIDESPLIRLTISPHNSRGDTEPICMIVELSAPFFYFHSDVTEMSMTDIIETLVSTAIESAVQEALDGTADPVAGTT